MTSREDALELFDSLEPVDIDFIDAPSQHIKVSRTIANDGVSREGERNDDL